MVRRTPEHCKGDTSPFFPHAASGGTWGHCIRFNFFVETQHAASLRLSGFERAGDPLAMTNRW